MPQVINTANPIWANLRKNIGLVGETVLGEKQRKRTRSEDIEDALELYKRKLEAQQEVGGGQMVNIVDPNTGEVKQIFIPKTGKGDKTYLGRKDIAPKKITQADLETILGRKGQEAEKEVGHLGGFPGLLEKFMPFGGKARQAEIGRRFEGKAGPVMKQFEQQFMPGEPQQFTGQAVGADEDLQALIDEYNTTTDQQRLRELELLLKQRGVQFQ